MHVNFYATNHGTLHVQDFLDYVRAGFEALGVHVRFNNALDPYTLNIILESFDDEAFLETLKQFKTVYFKTPILVIATEVLVDGVFNSARASGHDDDSSFYSDREMWESRTRAFFRADPFVDLYLCAAEEIYQSFLDDPRLAAKSQYMPLVWFPSFTNYKAPYLQIEPEDKDIDVFFSGTTTSHRKSYFSRFLELGRTSMVAPPNFPEYMRHHMMRRTRIYLGLKHFPHSRLLSKTRAYWMLCNGYFGMFEAGTNPTDLDEFLVFFNTPSEILDVLAEPEVVRQQMAAEKLAAFRNARTANPFAVAVHRLGLAG